MGFEYTQFQEGNRTNKLASEIFPASTAVLQNFLGALTPYPGTEPMIQCSNIIANSLSNGIVERTLLTAGRGDLHYSLNGSQWFDADEICATGFQDIKHKHLSDKNLTGLRVKLIKNDEGMMVDIRGLDIASLAERFHMVRVREGEAKVLIWQSKALTDDEVSQVLLHALSASITEDNNGMVKTTEKIFEEISSMARSLHGLKAENAPVI